MRFLKYPEILDLFEKEILSIDLDERIFEGMSTSDIINLDYQMKDRMLQENFLKWSESIHAKKDMLLHTSFSNSLWSTFLGKFAINRGEIFCVPLLERIFSKDSNIMGFLEIKEEFYNKGFRFCNGGLINLSDRALQSIEITNVKKSVSLIPNDTNIATLKIVAIP
jgi:hypothetical protein